MQPNVHLRSALMSSYTCTHTHIDPGTQAYWCPHVAAHVAPFQHALANSSVFSRLQVDKHIDALQNVLDERQASADSGKTAPGEC